MIIARSLITNLISFKVYSFMLELQPVVRASIRAVYRQHLKKKIVRDTLLTRASHERHTQRISRRGRCRRLPQLTHVLN